MVLLSGGLDSTTALYIALKEGYRTHALIVDYGQRHRKEIRRAVRIAEASGSPHRILKFSLPWGGSALLDAAASLPVHRRILPERIPATYVPARNLIFLSFAASWAEVLGAEAIVIGANALDYSGYPDCRPAFYTALRRTLAAGTKTGVEGRAVRIHTPLIRKTKAAIVRLAHELGVPLELTWSCYAGGRRPCGRCDSCVLRARGFAEAGIRDPLVST